MTRLDWESIVDTVEAIERKNMAIKTKSDYAKGVTAGLRLLKTMPSRYREHRHSYQREINTLVRKAEDKYREQIGDLVCPVTGEPACMRTSWFYEGVQDAIKYGHGAKFLVIPFNGNGIYNVDALVERTVYDDPALAWKRSWELDPHGHKYKSIDLLYVNGAVWELGLAEWYGL